MTGVFVVGSSRDVWEDKEMEAAGTTPGPARKRIRRRMHGQARPPSHAIAEGGGADGHYAVRDRKTNRSKCSRIGLTGKKKV